MSNTRRIAFNTIIQVIGKVITTVISLFLVAALTRYLGVSGYGQYTTIFAYLQFFAVFADFGFFWFLVREISKPDVDQEKIFNNVITFRSIMAAFIFTLAFFVAFLVPQYHDIRTGIGIIAAASFWQALNGTYVGIFQNRLRMDKAALTDVLGRIVILALVIWQIKMQMPLERILWSYFFGNLVNFVLSGVLGRVYVKFRFAFDFKFWKKIFRESALIFIVSILGIIYFKMDILMLSLLRSSTDVGIYGPSYKVIEILILLPAMFMGNVFPVVTRYIYAKDNRLGNAFQKSFDFLVITGIPIAVGVIFTASRVIEIVAGQEFLSAHTIAPIFGLTANSALALQILVIAVAISFLSHLFGYMIIALGKQTKMILPNVILVIFNIGLNIILIPRFSYIGAAAVTVLTEILVVYLYWRLMHRFIDLKIHWKILPKVILGSMILGLFLFICKNLSLWFLIPAGIGIYLIILYLVKGFSKESVLEIFRPKNI
ncbi:MAG: polysaccharide biosynthesis protein [Candidatus Berkelbacteria bacterium]|nr:polysaccharide biosynthesis protein [Candidatus Berkelbacteria bacterium]